MRCPADRRFPASHQTSGVFRSGSGLYANLGARFRHGLRQAQPVLQRWTQRGPAGLSDSIARDWMADIRAAGRAGILADSNRAACKSVYDYRPVARTGGALAEGILR